MTYEDVLLFVTKWGEGTQPGQEKRTPREVWDALGGDALEDAVALAAFDTALVMGLQRTLDWLEMCQHSGDPRVTVKAILAMREARCRSNKLFSVFGKEWLTRLTELKRESDALLPPT